MTHAAPEPDPKPGGYDPDGVYDVDADGTIDGPPTAGPFADDGPVDEPIDQPAEPGRTKEPVATSNVAQIVIAALVTAGWFTADSPWVGIIATAVGLVLSILVALGARAKVTPL